MDGRVKMKGRKAYVLIGTRVDARGVFGETGESRLLPGSVHQKALAPAVSAVTQLKTTRRI